MNNETLRQAAISHINVLCTEIPDRSVGSEGNRLATRYFRQILEENEWEPESTLLQVMDWKSEGATLQSGEHTFEVFSSPYANGCSVEGELVAISSLEQLQNTSLTGRIALLHGEIAKEQIMPRNFVFYNPEEHQQLIAALDNSGLKAIICATGFNPSLAGGVYPFPMFEDGDFDIPSVFMKDTEGDKLLAEAGKQVFLESKAIRIPETAYNVTGLKKGTKDQRIVITAHIDAKIGTPGAIDNATGVAVLLLLSDLLKDYQGRYPVELVAFNGEDYYAVPGQMKYIEQNDGSFQDILLNINIDGAGYREGLSAFSPFGLTEGMEKAFSQVLEHHPAITQGIPWVQGDHSIFVQFGRPAIAVSSEWFINNMETQRVTHTPDDHPEIINYDRLPEIAMAIRDFISLLGGNNLP
jgi:aminopeptidase YwaD